MDGSLRNRDNLCYLVIIYLWQKLDGGSYTLFPAIFIVLVQIVAPFFMMQPAFGFGIAASKMPNLRICKDQKFCVHILYMVSAYIFCFIN